MNGNGARINWRWVASVLFTIASTVLVMTWKGSALWTTTAGWKQSVEERFMDNDQKHSTLFSELGDLKTGLQSNGATIQQVFDRQTILIDIACASAESTEAIRLMCRRVQNNGNNGPTRGGMGR